MNREELLTKLANLQPALAKNELVPVYTCYVFNGKTVLAYNHEICIIAPCETKVKFAADGRLLLGLLNATTSEDVDFEFDKKDVLIKGGKSKLKIAYLPEEEFQFVEPDSQEASWEVELVISDTIVEGIEAALTTAGNDYAFEALMGVNFNADTKAIYSLDGDCLTKFSADFDGSGSYTLPTSFCENLLKLRGADQGTLYMNDGWAMAMLDGYTLYGRMREKPADLDHENLIGQSVDYDDEFVGVPEGFIEALARAQVLADRDSKPTSLIVHKNKITLETSTHMGHVRDELTIKHPNVEAVVHASLIAKPLKLCDEMLVKQNCTAYRKGENLLQIVSNVGDNGD